MNIQKQLSLIKQAIKLYKKTCMNAGIVPKDLNPLKGEISRKFIYLFDNQGYKVIIHYSGSHLYFDVAGVEHVQKLQYAFKEYKESDLQFPKSY